MTMNRRSFLRQSLAGTAVVGSGLSAVAQSPASIPPVTGKSTEPGRGKPFDVARVKEFVGAGHGNLPRVKAMLAEQPQLVLASYDWGSGDFETALGGAAHFQTLLASCLAMVEAYANDTRGIHAQMFMERLMASVHHDRQAFGAKSFGLMRDPGMGTPPLPQRGNIVTYTANGITY